MISYTKTTADQKPSSIIGCHRHPEMASMTEIYRDEINIAIWQRDLAQNIIEAAKMITIKYPSLQLSCATTPLSATEIIRSEFGDNPAFCHLANDISSLVEMFCDLFDLEQAGLRMKVLSEAMCPRLHVDRVPCRLITTYCGISTEWLPNHLANRSKLGAGNCGMPDDKSGIYQKSEHIEKLATGDVAILKGESWMKNEGKGLVHRSPQPANNQKRLVVTLDFLDRDP